MIEPRELFFRDRFKKKLFFKLWQQRENGCKILQERNELPIKYFQSYHDLGVSYYKN